MKRDMELVRRLLLAIEQEKTGEGLGFAWPEGYDAAVVQHHLRLLLSGGLIRGRETGPGPGGCVMPEGLTWAGCEFLDSIRDETAWGRAKAEAARRGEALTFEVVKAVVSGLVRGHLGGG